MIESTKYYTKNRIPTAVVVVKKTMRSFPLMGILTIIFVLAKIFDKLDWSWFMVFWPIWIFPAIFLGIIGVFIITVIIWFCGALVFDEIGRRRRRRRKSK